MAASCTDETSFKEMIDTWYWSMLEDTDILETILSCEDEMVYFLASDHTTTTSISMLVHVLGRAVGCKSLRDRPKVYSLLNLVLDSPLLNLKGMQLLTECDAIGSHTMSCLLNDFVEIFVCLSTYMPSSLGTPHIIGFIDLLRDKVNETYDLDNKTIILNQVFELKNAVISKIAELAKMKKSHCKSDYEDSMKPPKSFRKVPVMPEENDLLYQTSFLRSNKKRGRYNDLEHYLDVQFRLYREDCIVPLREIFEDFLQKQEQNRSFRLESGRIYRNIQILNGTSTSLEHGEVFIVELDQAHCKRIKWNNSKRLIFGSLLLLSFDDFKSTLFAVVSDADREVLREIGHFKVKIFKTQPNQHIPRETKGIILEATSAYFEAYYHVLNAIQAIHGIIPFQRYIVDCESEIDMPKFLANNPDCTFDVQPIFGNSLIQLRKDDGLYEHGYRSFSRQESEIKEHTIQLLDIDNWPTKEQLHLDESQRQAFITALTKEFVLIQGPPGTGKTYLGLQIAKALLHNKDKWKKINDDKSQTILSKTTQKPCILVVCYTNHALDQFIEGMIDFFPSHSSSEIVRIGSQCKNKNVEKYSIKTLRKYFTRNRRAFEVVNEADRCKQKIMMFGGTLKTLQNRNIVLYFHLLQGFMQESQRQYFVNAPMEGWFDWLHVSPTVWFYEVQKRYHNKRKKKQIKGKKIEENDENFIEVVEEADYAHIERSLDGDDNFTPDISTFGVDVQEQLRTILQQPLDEKCKAILHEEVDNITSELKSGVTASKLLILYSGNILELSLSDRWKLYRYWLKCYSESLKIDLEKSEEEFNAIFKDYRQARTEIDEDIMRKASVIAMTTTGAAKYHGSLQKICPQITIIEEAAEVPEAHIVTAINPQCEHVILIGDHKQLEPKPAVMELAVKYNLSISLFERMLNNGLHYHCLERQHRMRPEISNLVRHMYPVLEDNDNVYEYENIKGIRQNLFFIDHDHNEQFNEDGKSYSNEFEANFIARLCEYLLKQGYRGNEITILAAYTGQMFCIREKMPRSRFEGVNICVLDNYQGEENEIILLSLVRSNPNGDIGFLSRENRICVALSRAKKGLYIVGNSSTLTNKSKHWQYIINKIKGKEDQNSVYSDENLCSFGKSLPLYCQNHLDAAGIRVSSPDDFSSAPEGGCSRPCEARLDCGHACRYRCHPFDRDHKEYTCTKLCRKLCKEGHICEKQCHFPEKCNCSIMMDRLLECNHTAILECYINPNIHACKEKINGIREKCKHEFVRDCHDKDFETNKECNVMVKKTFSSCGHTETMQCHFDIETALCMETVEKSLTCGHVKTLKCYESKASNIPCYDTCGKTCENGHICEDACHYPNKCYCEYIVDKFVPKCGHHNFMHCSQDVDTFTDCNMPVEMVRQLCTHQVVIECHLKTNIEDANEMTRNHLEKRIKCEHLIEYELPECKHLTEIPCWRTPESSRFERMVYHVYSRYEALSNIKCEAEVSYELECGHTKNIECWRKAEIQKPGSLLHPKQYLLSSSAMECRFKVTAELECGHVTEIECWQKEKENCLNLKCTAKIDVELEPCGHMFTAKCYEKSTIAHTAVCEKEIPYTYPECLHKASIQCNQNPNLTKQRTTQSLQKSTKEQNRIPPCSAIIKRMLDCGHVKHTLCHVKICSPECEEKCSKLLFCGHPCSDLCNNCKTRGTHKNCDLFCKNELFCGHNCKQSKCLRCTFCHKQCEFSCEHFVCKLPCKEPCKPCKEPCSWICPHFKCTKSCTEECDRPLCSEDCKLTLSCGHVCPGYCGEPCPVACMFCDAERYTEKPETMSSGKFVTLRECCHSFGSEFLDEFISKNIMLVVKCPVCKTIVHKHPRYDSTFKRKKRALEMIKIQLGKAMVQPACFPVMDHRIIEQFVRYVGKFLTYLEIIEFVERDEKSQSERCRLKDKGEHLMECINNVPRRNFQNWIDVSDAMFLLHVNWILRLCSKNKNMMEKEFNIGNSNLIFCRKYHFDNRESKTKQDSDLISKTDTRTVDIKSDSESISSNASQNDEEKEGEKGNTFYDSLTLEAEKPADVDTTLPCQLEIQNLRSETRITGLQIVQILSEGSKDEDRKNVKDLIELLTKDIKDESHVTEAMEYPKLTIAMGVHSSDWTVCTAGHVTPAVICDTCLTCSKTEEMQWGAKNNDLSLNTRNFGKLNKRGPGKGKRSFDAWSAKGKNQKQTNQQNVFALPSLGRPAGENPEGGSSFINSRGRDKQPLSLLPTQDKGEALYVNQSRPDIVNSVPNVMVSPQGQYSDRENDDNRYRGRRNRQQRQRGGRHGARNERSSLADSIRASMFQFRPNQESSFDNSQRFNFHFTNNDRRDSRKGHW